MPTLTDITRRAAHVCVMGWHRARQRRARIGAIIGTGAFGFVAGIVGGLVVVAGYPLVVAPGAHDSTGILRRSSTPSIPVSRSVTRALRAATVDIFVVDAGQSLPALLPITARAGRGIALTNDGWVVTVRDAVPGVLASGARRIPVLMGANREFISIDRIVPDPMTNLVFLHAAHLDAAVLPLRQRRAFEEGIAAYLPAPEGGIAPTAVRALRAQSVSGSTGRMSDRWATAIALADDPIVLPGTPLVDAEGALLGVYERERSVIPADAVRPVLPSVFRDGVVTRNALGIMYRDSADFVFPPGKSEEGITVLAVATRGAATGLRVGDRIVAIGDDALTPHRQLPDLLQEYPVGARLDFHVIRAGRALTLPVTLPVLRSDALLVTAPPRR